MASDPRSFPLLGQRRKFYDSVGVVLSALDDQRFDASGDLCFRRQLRRIYVLSTAFCMTVKRPIHFFGFLFVFVMFPVSVLPLYALVCKGAPECAVV